MRTLWCLKKKLEETQSVIQENQYTGQIGYQQRVCQGTIYTVNIIVMFNTGGTYLFCVIISLHFL